MSPATACPDDDELARFADGALTDARRRDVLAHVEGCGACLSAVAGAFGEEAKPGLRPGDVVGRYELGELLGAGGMGVVFRARDRELGRDVALKVVHPDRRDDSALHERLRAEARALAQVSSPYVVSVFDVGRVEGRDETFIAMELVEGTTLRAWLAEAKRSEREILSLFLQAGEGLATAHAKGVVHRDFKPDNLLVGRDGRARVGDFGLARADLVATTDAPARSGALTRNAGTPAYMAPEQHDGGGASQRSDQYAFCLSLVEALTGVRPATDDVHRAARSLREPLRSALLRGLAADPEARHPHLGPLLAVLRRLVAPARPMWPVVVGIVAIFGVAGGVWMRARVGACDVGRLEIAPALGPERVTAVRGAMARAGGTPASLDVVAASLARWSAAWVQERDASCRAGQAAAREACLVGQRERVRAFVRAVEEGAAPDLATVVEAAQRLPEPTHCVGAIDDGPSTEASLALARRLDDASVLRWTTRGADAPAALAAIAADARRAGNVRIALRADVERGLAELSLAHHGVAREVLVRANEEARRHGATDVALDGTVALVEAFARDGERQLAILLGGVARAEIQHQGADPVREAAVLRALCLAAERMADGLEGGIALCFDARDRTRAVHGADDFRLAHIEDTLGDALWRLGRHGEAEGHYRAALDLYERILGPDTPAADRFRENLAYVRFEQGHPEEAEAAFRKLAQRKGHRALLHDSIAAVRRSLLDYEGEIEERRIALEMCVAQGQRLCQFFEQVGLASASALAGRIPEAEAAIDAAERLGIAPSRVDRMELVLAEALVAIAHGEPRRACRRVEAGKALVVELGKSTNAARAAVVFAALERKHCR